MRPIFASLLVAALLAPLAPGAPPDAKNPPDPKADKAAEAAQAFQAKLGAIIDEYNLARGEFFGALRSAPSDEEREKALARYPRPDSFAARVVELAAKEPNQPAALEAFVWVLVQTGRGDLRKHQAAAAEGMLKRFANDDRLAESCQQLGAGLGNAATESLLRKLLEQSEKEAIKGHACFALANLLKTNADTVPQVAGLEGIQRAFVETQFGKDFLAELAKRDAPKLYAEAETLFDRVVKEFGKLEGPRGTLGEAADSELFELRHLAIGKPAPAIDGEDVDGVKFSLADYRGKIVVLDFWGHW